MKIIRVRIKLFFNNYSNLSVIYAQCVHKKNREDTSERKDTRSIKHTYYNGCFLILLLVKSRLRTFQLLTIRLLYFFNMKTKDKAVHI